MTKSSPLSVRGRRALTLIRDERELSLVRRQLARLGVAVAECNPADAPSHVDAADVVILDGDLLPIRSDLLTLWPTDVPIVALIGTETPSRLKWLLDLEPACFLVKPLRSAGLYTALAIAFDRAQKRAEDAKTIERLEERVRARRVVIAAVLQIMRSHDLSEPEAFSLMRRAAMQRRTTVERLSADIVATGDLPGRAAQTA